jgi:hypothetical protein
MFRDAAAAVLLLTIAAAAPRGQTGERIMSVKDVMRRAAAYVDAYGEKASIVVATEHYTQEARSSLGGAAGRTVRRIVADFAIVKVSSLRGWQGFRDVVEVDGTRVVDRDDRLVRILLESEGRYDEAQRLSNESARFNIGAIFRNFNVPTSALFFFRTENLDRFNFTARGVQPDGTWEIAFRETSRPTLIRTPEGRSLASEGSLWVNPADGTVVRTRLKVADFVPRAARTRASGRVDVTYRHVPTLDMWLPVSMDEDFDVTRTNDSETISGRALYSNYRQFQTTVRIK